MRKRAKNGGKWRIGKRRTGRSWRNGRVGEMEGGWTGLGKEGGGEEGGWKGEAEWEKVGRMDRGFEYGET
jgi:hypothetical protein